MLIRLDKIEDEPFRWNQVETVAVETLDRVELVGLSEIAWSGVVQIAAPGFRFNAEVAYEQTLACSRCLKPQAERVSSSIDLFVVSGASEPVEHELELDEEDLGVWVAEKGVLDTDEFLVEQLQLNVPMSKLCKDDCVGLCPHCGEDRNESPDCCHQETIDPRWQALKDLKERS